MYIGRIQRIRLAEAITEDVEDFTCTGMVFNGVQLSEFKTLTILLILDYVI